LRPSHERQTEEPESCQQAEKNILRLHITEKEAAAIAVGPHIYTYSYINVTQMSFESYMFSHTCVPFYKWRSWL